MCSNKNLEGIEEALSLNRLVMELAKRGEKFFRQTHPNAFFLVVSCPRDGVLRNDSGIRADSDFLRLKTELTTGGTPPPAGSPAGEWAIELVKTDRNVYKSKITIGRAHNNDIVIRINKISKLHSVFNQERDGSYSLVDMGSVNGTTVNDVKLEKNKPVEIKNGDMITFWRYQFQFVEPEPFLQLLRDLSSKTSQ